MTHDEEVNRGFQRATNCNVRTYAYCRKSATLELQRYSTAIADICIAVLAHNPHDQIRTARQSLECKNLNDYDS